MKRFPTLFLLLLACNDIAGPDRGDPAQFVLTQPSHFGCGYWFPEQPNAEFGVFDITWDRDDEARTSKRQARLRVLGAGGTIVRQFEAGFVRAILPIEHVAKLRAENVAAVGDPSDLTVNVWIRFFRPPNRGVLDLFESLGGTVTREITLTPSFIGSIPDPAVPLVRTFGRVNGTSPNFLALICLFELGTG